MTFLLNSQAQGVSGKNEQSTQTPLRGAQCSSIGLRPALAVRSQIETGADVSTICRKFVYPDQVRPCTRNLVMWNKTAMTLVGETSSQVYNPKNGEVVGVDFIVVKNSFNC